MIWHIIARVGEHDTFVPSMTMGEPHIVVPLNRPSDPWRIHENIETVFEEANVTSPRGIASDLLRLGIAAYTADIRISRDFGDDKWQRKFALYLPVSNTLKWNRAKRLVVELLSFLTGDSWLIEFRDLLIKEEAPVTTAGRAIDAVCLFSGGLDSLVGAINGLYHGQKLALVGHHGAGLTNTFQNRSLKVLAKHYEGRFVPLLFRVQPPKNRRRKRREGKQKAKERDIGEPTMRARSILFFSLGIAVAEGIGGGLTLIAAENGLISLNVPLTMARQASLSTRTTHPYVIEKLRAMLKSLGLKTQIVTPYRFKTKGEMLAECKGQEALAEAAPLTMSCSHTESGRWQGVAGKHCGYCVPCIIRRASTFAAKVPDARYVVDPRENPASPGSERGRDLRAFEIGIERFFDESREEMLGSIISTGPIAAEDVPNFVDTYCNGMAEVASFLRIKKPKLLKKKK